MSLKLYMVPYSQPVRAVLMTIKALNISVELIEVNLLEKQQLSSEYTKLNPQHSVPTLDDDGFIIWDSHAIMAYLVDKYSNGNLLYPTDLKKRAIITQRLHFESGVLFPRTMAIIRPIIYGNEKAVPAENIEAVVEAYEFLEKFLEGNDWVAGSEVTIADFSIASSITTLDVIVPVDAEKFPNIIKWLERIEKLPCNEPNKIGLDLIREIIRNKMS